MEFPEEEALFQRCWSAAAGELAGIKKSIVLVEARTVTAFFSGQDEIARVFRKLLKDLGEMRDEASNKLDKFINENRRRQEAACQTSEK